MSPTRKELVASTIADRILDTVVCFLDTCPDFDEETDIVFGDRVRGMLDKESTRRQHVTICGKEFAISVEEVQKL